MSAPLPPHAAPPVDRSKWIVLSSSTLGMLAAAINSSILLISLPAVFRGIDLKALDPRRINYLLWAITVSALLNLFAAFTSCRGNRRPPPADIARSGSRPFGEGTPRRTESRPSTFSIWLFAYTAG